jgi:23S rRNA (cytidine1920-2'-O)/16S rRNA (cytidine1409-2'-O)-methyltransferase
LKERLDILLVNKGFFTSRERAQASIMAGVVYVGGMREEKSGTRFDENAEIEVREEILKYVGRGGLKLEKAIEYWEIDLQGKIVMDVGASTGGFTDAMLQSGAARVYAIDVGYGQLDWKLRNDPRVTNMERTNIRYLDPAVIPEKPDLVTIDVSFISLKLVLPTVASVIKPGGAVIALLKPQFEAERAQVGKKGIIKDPKIHEEVIEKVKRYAEENGFEVQDVTDSPIHGAKGNKEFLMRLKNVFPA